MNEHTASALSTKPVSGLARGEQVVLEDFLTTLQLEVFPVGINEQIAVFAAN